MREIYLKQMELGPMRNFIYLIGDPQSRDAAVVDPGWEVPAILEAAKWDGYRITGVFATHHHFDHVQGLGELLDAVDAPVYVHRDDAPEVGVAHSSLKPVAGGETVQIGRVAVTLIHTPGHTPGSQCLLVDPVTTRGNGVDGRLLSGDTLFIGSCGRCDLPGGDARQLYESLTKRLKPLDDRTLLYPGHHYAPPLHVELGEEKRTNPFLSAATWQEFRQLVSH